MRVLRKVAITVFTILLTISSFGCQVEDKDSVDSNAKNAAKSDTKTVSNSDDHYQKTERLEAEKEQAEEEVEKLKKQLEDSQNNLEAKLGSADEELSKYELKETIEQLFLELRDQGVTFLSPSSGTSKGKGKGKAKGKKHPLLIFQSKKTDHHKGLLNEFRDSGFYVASFELSHTSPRSTDVLDILSDYNLDKIFSTVVSMGYQEGGDNALRQRREEGFKIDYHVALMPLEAIPYFSSGAKQLVVRSRFLFVDFVNGNINKNTRVVTVRGRPNFYFNSEVFGAVNSFLMNNASKAEGGL